MTLLNPKNLQKIKVLKSYTDPFHTSPCCFLELSLKRTGNRLCVSFPVFFCYWSYSRFALPDQENRPIHRHGHIPSLRASQMKPSWWQRHLDDPEFLTSVRTAGHWVNSISNVRFLFDTFDLADDYDFWPHEIIQDEALKNLHLKHLRYNCASKAKVVWKQGPRRFGSFHHWTGNPAFLGAKNRTLGALNPFQWELLSRCPAPFSNPKRRRIPWFGGTKSTHHGPSGPRGQLPGLDSRSFFAKNAWFFVFFGGSLWFGFKGM